VEWLYLWFRCVAPSFRLLKKTSTCSLPLIVEIIWNYTLGIDMSSSFRLSIIAAAVRLFFFQWYSTLEDDYDSDMTFTRLSTIKRTMNTSHLSYVLSSDSNLTLPLQWPICSHPLLHSRMVPCTSPHFSSWFKKKNLT